jgi:hypothetical protein
VADKGYGEKLVSDKGEKEEALFPEDLEPEWYTLSSSLFLRLSVEREIHGRKRDGFVHGIGKQYFITTPDLRKTLPVRTSFR